MDDKGSLDPRLAGTTGALCRGSVVESSRKDSVKAEDSLHWQQSDNHASQICDQSDYFKSAQWSPDGTTVLTSSADNVLRSFILPVDLLDPAPTPQILLPYATHQLPEPSYATAFHGSFDLQNPSSTLFLTSIRALPIRLLSPFSQSIVASYPLVSLTTERYIAPHSLLFPLENPNHFFAGSESLVSTFDINRNGQGPLSRAPTTPSRRNRGGIRGGLGMKGIVSALAISCEGLLAAGTFSRWIGLYDGHGRGGTVGIFKVEEGEGEDEDVATGNGTTQVIWSSCGRYLCVVERESNGIGIWDVRGTGRRLSWLRGRMAQTKQRLGVDILGSEIWGGGTDGMVRVWEKLGMAEGDVSPTGQFHAHDDAVSSTGLHPRGSVLATCSGQRHFSNSAYGALDHAENGKDGTKSESESVDGDENSYTQSILSSNSHSSDVSSSSTDSFAFSPIGRKMDSSMRIWAWQ